MANKIDSFLLHEITTAITVPSPIPFLTTVFCVCECAKISADKNTKHKRIKCVFFIL